MKNYIFFCILLSFCLSANGQQITKRDSIANTVNEYVRAVNIAADFFLNRELSPDERLDAIDPYPFIYDTKQAERFKLVVIDGTEAPSIRAAALNKIYQFVDTDEKLLDQVMQWLVDTKTPEPLRGETLNLISSLSFSSLDGILEIYPKMLEDPELTYRSFAASKLIIHGDARTQQRLINGLENPNTALFEPAFAIELLALAPKKSFYPVAYKILLESEDKSARLAAIQTLGPYRPARDTIIGISHNSNEEDAFRTSALLALYSGDRENIFKYVSPLLLDKAAPTVLHALCIQIAIEMRKSMAYRRSKAAEQADEHDRLMLSFSEGKELGQSKELQDLATRYLLLVKPNF